MALSLLLFFLTILNTSYGNYDCNSCGQLTTLLNNTEYHIIPQINPFYFMDSGQRPTVIYMDTDHSTMIKMIKCSDSQCTSTFQKKLFHSYSIYFKLSE